MIKSIRLGFFKKPFFAKGEDCMFNNYELSTVFIIAQVVGFIATGVAIASFQAKRRINMLMMQTVSNLLWMAHYFMLGSLPATFAFLIGATRNIIYGFRGKYKFADSKMIPAFYIVAFIVSGILTYETPLDILPTVGMVFASIAFFVKDERVIRYISVLIAISFFSFGVYQGSFASIVSDGSTLISIVIAMIRYRGFDQYEKNTPDLSVPIEESSTDERENNDKIGKN